MSIKTIFSHSTRKNASSRVCRPSVDKWAVTSDSQDEVALGKKVDSPSEGVQTEARKNLRNRFCVTSCACQSAPSVERVRMRCEGDTIHRSREERGLCERVGNREDVARSNGKVQLTLTLRFALRAHKKKKLIVTGLCRSAGRSLLYLATLYSDEDKF